MPAHHDAKERPKYYLLNGKETQPATLEQWAKFMQDGNRLILRFIGREFEVSTVFLGLDHAWGDEEPVLFETMVFGGKHDQYQERYSTYEEAEEGHNRILQMVLSDR